MKRNDIDFKVLEVENANEGLKVHHVGFNPIDSLEWQSAVASVTLRLMSTWWSN
jgi:hypothetical protein